MKNYANIRFRVIVKIAHRVMGETLEITLRVQIGVGRYLRFNPRPLYWRAESAPPPPL